jgi:hypothetical protein
MPVLLRVTVALWSHCRRVCSGTIEKCCLTEIQHSHIFFYLTALFFYPLSLSEPSVLPLTQTQACHSFKKDTFPMPPKKTVATKNPPAAATSKSNRRRTLTNKQQQLGNIFRCRVAALLIISLVYY